MKITRETMLELVAKIPGMMDQTDLEFLFDKAGSLSTGGLWIEVGAWKGKSFAASVLGGATGASFMAVDTWLGSPDELNQTAFAEAIKGDGPFEAFKQTVYGCKFLRPDLRIGFMRTFSVAAAQALEPHSADVVFIDGQHTYAAVMDDLREWSNVVKPGGTMIGHDRNLPGVARALKDCKLFDHIEQRGDVIWEGVWK